MSSDEIAKVSVVIPTITLDSWFEQALESVLQQEHIEVQVIVVLDGIEDSSSHCPLMDDPRVTVLRNPQRMGVGASLRRAMAEVQSDYVARLDADDIAKPGRMARQSEYLRQHPDTVAVTSQVDLINGDGEVTGQMPFRPAEDVRHQLLLQNVVVQSAVMFRLKDYQLVGGYEPLRQMEDYHLWLRLARHGKIAILPEKLVEYRVHGAQLSRGAKPYGTHISKVLIERQRLRRTLQTKAVVSCFYDATWIGVQYLRYYVLTPLRGLPTKVRRA